MIVYLICILALIAFFLATLPQKVPKELMPKSPYHIFGKMAFVIYKSIQKCNWYFFQKGKAAKYLSYEKTVFNSIKKLSPGKDKELERHKYYMEKISMAIMVVVVGVFLAAFISLDNQKEQVIMNGNVITRNDYGKNSLSTKAVVTDQEGEERMLDLEISERQYSQEQIEELLEEFEPLLHTKILGENKSLNHVDHDLVLAKQYDGYPFKVKWSTLNHGVLKDDGTLGKEITTKGEIVELIATISYEQYSWEYVLYCNVYQIPPTEEELFQMQLQEAVEQADQDSITEKEIVLPEQVNGTKISWSEEKKDSSLQLLLLFLVIAVLLFFLRDKDLSQKCEDRKEEMLIDYPEIVSKLTILVGAGMPLKSAWKRIVSDYSQKAEEEEKQHFAYEEMKIALREMESGVSEVQAIEHFAKRCEIQEYTKLSSLITQNLKKGTSDFVYSMRTEADRALLERRNFSKIQGEKASTKLMMPMMLMLMVVLIMIVVPALSVLG